MSGPWDRPPSPGSDDATWPSEDLESRAPDASSPEPWSPDDPWQESRSDPASGWGEWSASPPSPADYAVDAVDLPSSDPWSETWTDDDPILDQPPPAEAPSLAPIADEPEPIPQEPEAVADELTAPPVEPEPIAEEPEPAPEPIADASEAEGAWEPIPREPERTWKPIPREPERTWAPIPREPERVWEPAPVEEPASELALEAAPELAPEAAAEPGADEAGEADVAIEPSQPEPIFSPLSRTTEAWVPAPVAEPWGADDDRNGMSSSEEKGPPPLHPDRSEVAGWETVEAAELEAETWGAPPRGEVIVTDVDEEVTPTDAEPAAEMVAETGVDEADIPIAAAEETTALRVPDWLPEPIPEPRAEVEVEEEPAAAEPEPEAEAEPEPLTPPAEPIVAGPAHWWDTAEPEPAAEAAALADADDEAAAPSWRAPEADLTESGEPPMATVAWDADVEAPAAPIEAPEAEVAEPAEPEPEPEPDMDVAADEKEDEEPPNPFPFLDGTWPRGDATEVLPATWEPSPPVPRKPFVDLDPTPGSVRTSIARREGTEAAEEPTTAEQAVPWLIGIILLLAGMVIVLLALIFAGDSSLGGLGAQPSESALAGAPDASASPSVAASNRPSATPQPSGSGPPTQTPAPLPEYGPLEMVYQGRAAALAPIYLLRHDFTTEDDPQVMAQDPALDVRRLAWAPDGRIGAGLLADVLVSIEPGQEKRRLGDGITTITFGDSGDVVYAVRVTQDGAEDVAHVLAIDFISGDTNELASVSYARPEIAEEPALAEAQFSDDGGTVRLFWMHDDTLRLWALGAGTWQVDPGSGEVLDQEEALPLLWSPDGRRRIAIHFDDGTTRITLTNHSGGTLSETTMTGRISHLRWSRDGERVAFTLGRSAAGGGVLQDLFLWDLEDGVAPMQLTSTGAAFGAEWLGTTPRWEAG